MSIKDQGIKDFLAKPQLVHNGVWNTSDVANTIIKTIDIANTLLSVQVWANKLEGFNMFRGTAVLTIIVNANPFQQGKLLGHFLPMRDTFSDHDPSYEAMHNQQLTSKRMQPCVEIDCRDSGAVMKIPYVTPANWYSRTAPTYDWGTFFVSVFSPLKTGSGGENSVALSIYMHFEDFELAAPIVPQSSGPTKKYHAKAMKEQNVLSSGVISKGLGLAASVASALDVVPVLTPIAKPASWVFRGLEALSSHFGWSKANIEATSLPVVRSVNRCAAVSDGVDSAVPLALINTNRTSISSTNSITNEDEMSFNYLKKIPGYIYDQTWTTSQANGTILVNLPISPASSFTRFFKSVSTHDVAYDIGPPMFYLSKLFSGYRGSIKVTLKAVKSDFHSGRLQVVYTPISNTPTVYPSLSNSTLALREIIDLRTGSEFTLDIPFLAPTNYLDMDEIMGTLTITVLNELRCPETCSQNIDILIFMAGGDDLEFEGPSNRGPDDTLFPGGSFVRTFSPQMDTKQVVNEPIGNSEVPRFRLNYAQESYGENFASVKQLLNRMNPVYYKTLVPASGNNASGVRPTFYPFSTGVISMDATTGDLISPNVGGDIHSYLANMYCLYHGGMSVQIIPGNTGDLTVGLVKLIPNVSQVIDLVTPGFGYRGVTTWSSGSLMRRANACGTYTNDGNLSITVVEVPYYCRKKASLVTNSPPSSSIAITSKSQPTHAVCFGSSSDSTLLTYALSKSARDDFQLSYFIGCPPVHFSGY